MRPTTSGVIAITSLLTLVACTVTETTTETRTDSPAAKPDDPGASWKSRLALARAPRDSARALLGSKVTDHGVARVRAGAAGGTCGLGSGDATCDACLDASCCAENTACVSDADCTAAVACLDACRDDACFSACVSAHPTGIALLESLSTCADASCTSACGGPVAPPASACGFASGDATCDACLDGNCCGAADACLNDADCTALLDCGEPCADGACWSACEAAHPSGAAKLGALSTCATSTCGTACSGPSAPPAGSCGLTSGDATCDACLDGSCCGATTACLGDADCVALVTCYDTCADAACAAACDAAHPSGATALAAVFTCAETQCAPACGL